MECIRIFLADDHQIFLDGLTRLIKDQQSMKIVGTAKNGRECVKQVQTLQPDVALVDISMPMLNGIETTRLIRKTNPKTKIIILSMHENEEFLRRVLEAGAVGYLLKDSAIDELFNAIHQAYRGNAYLSPSLSRKLIMNYLVTRKNKPKKMLDPVLTGKEREILQLLAEGNTNQTIAAALNISTKTVETHRKKMMSKLDLHSIVDLVKYAIQTRIIEN